MGKRNGTYVRKRINGFYILLAVVSVLLFMEGKFRRQGGYIYAADILFLVGAVLFLIHLNRHYLYHFRNQSDYIRSIPLKEIKLKNILLFSGYLVINAGFMFLILLLQWKGVFGTVSGKAPVPSAKILYGHFSGAMEETLPEQSGDTLELVSYLEFVFKLVAGACAVAAILFMIAFLYRKISGRKETGHYIEQREYMKPVMDREEKAKEAAGKKNIKYAGRNPNIKIRRLYIRRITGAKKRGMRIGKNLTPGEIEDYVGIEDTAERKRLHALYEKARYSKEGCTDSDVAGIVRKG